MANNRPAERLGGVSPPSPVRPRVASLLRQVALSFQNRIRPFQDSFSLILFSLLFGFLLANIFGTFLNVLRDAVSWDGFVILGIVLFVEITNYLTYHPLRSTRPHRGSAFRRTGSAVGALGVGAPMQSNAPNRWTGLWARGRHRARWGREPKGQREGRSRQLTSNAAIANRKVIYRIVNSFKIGMLLGFFVEAFKVGS